MPLVVLLRTIEPPLSHLAPSLGVRWRTRIGARVGIVVGVKIGCALGCAAVGWAVVGCAVEGKP